MASSKKRQGNRVKLIFEFITVVFSLVKNELDIWRKIAEEIPDFRLRRQALESMQNKAFHCQGGSVYALYPGVNREEAVRFIVAYQTMSDYLDNLVDSLEVRDEQAFAELHFAMYEALEPGGVTSAYYASYPYRDDGGYLKRLVITCQNSLEKLPAYPEVQEEAVKFAKLYSRLQTYKHLSSAEREYKLLNWCTPYLQNYHELSAWEFAAATGSTLGIFCLYAAAGNPNLTKGESQGIGDAYFPWICGLHILLDYFIDLQEDEECRQLNFVTYYKDSKTTGERLDLFVKRSLAQTKLLVYPQFHRLVVQGLLAMYLSDEKCLNAEIRPIAGALSQNNGLGVKVLYSLCSCLRKLKRL